jgi:hypothetical protein
MRVEDEDKRVSVGGDLHFYPLSFSTFLPFDICLIVIFDIFYFQHFYFRLYSGQSSRSVLVSLQVEHRHVYWSAALVLDPRCQVVCPLFQGSFKVTGSNPTSWQKLIMFSCPSVSFTHSLLVRLLGGGRGE